MEFLRFFYSFVWVRILVCYWNHCRVTINYKALWVFSGMPQQYLNKELGYELELWTWFIEKNVDAVMLGKNTFVLAFFLPLKLVWGVHLVITCSQKIQPMRRINRTRNYFFTSFLEFQSHLYITGWFILRKVYFTEREGVTEKRGRKRGLLY